MNPGCFRLISQEDSVDREMEEQEEWTKESLFAFLKPKHPELAEFATALIDDFGEEEAAALLTKEWDGAYPSDFIGDDINNNISNFLYNMADFCVKRAKREKKYDEHLEGYLNIYVVPSYEDASYVLICDYDTATVVSKYSGKTWYFNPETLEGDIGDLIESIEKGIELVRSRDTDSILARASKQLEKAEKMLDASSAYCEKREDISTIVSDIKEIRNALLGMASQQVGLSSRRWSMNEIIRGRTKA